jgi:RimJ/RimL family protein N-acetyltransferase
VADPSAQATADTLKNGVAVTIRPLRAEDREQMATAVRSLDRESVYTRLFSYRNELTESGLDRIMSVDPAHEVALVVTLGEGAGQTIIGGCRYIETARPDGERTAEVAFTVEEDYQGQGIAGKLIARLVAIGRARGAAALEADVLAKNKSMLAVFARTGLPLAKRHDGDSLHVTLSLRDAAG